jgi:hypothetical protein
MSARDTLLKVRSKLVAILDTKLENLSEWQMLKDIDKELLDFPGSSPIPRATGTRPRSDSRKKTYGGKKTYAGLAALALETTKAPIPTQDMIKFIAQHRELKGTARINIVSALSHDGRFDSVPWNGGRGWWWADRPAPAQGFQIVVKEAKG